MKATHYYIIAAILAAILVTGNRGAAQSPAQAEVAADVATLRPVASAYTLEAGSSSVTDTYLSPSTYRGWHIGLGYERLQVMGFGHDCWTGQLQGRVSLDRGFNAPGNLATWSGQVDLSWGFLYRFAPVGKVNIAVGPALNVNAGIIYADRAGNNPASAKAAVTVDATAIASWSTRLGRLPITLRYQPTLSLLGAFFAPDYDELYYEIYLGNRHRLAHCASPFNRFAMTNYVTADLRLGSSALRLGFRSTVLSSKANHLTTNWFTWQAVVGISGEWLSASRVGHLSSDARIISAIY